MRSVEAINVDLSDLDNLQPYTFSPPRVSSYEVQNITEFLKKLYNFPLKMKKSKDNEKSKNQKIEDLSKRVACGQFVLIFMDKQSPLAIFDVSHFYRELYRRPYVISPISESQHFGKQSTD